MVVTCGNGHIALAGLNYSFWCRIVWDSVVVNLSLWEIMSDFAGANLGIDDLGVKFRGSPGGYGSGGQPTI